MSSSKAHICSKRNCKIWSLFVFASERVQLSTACRVGADNLSWAWLSASCNQLFVRAFDRLRKLNDMMCWRVPSRRNHVILQCEWQFRWLWKKDPCVIVISDSSAQYGTRWLSQDAFECPRAHVKRAACNRVCVLVLCGVPLFAVVRLGTPALLTLNDTVSTALLPPRPTLCRASTGPTPSARVLRNPHHEHPVGTRSTAKESKLRAEWSRPCIRRIQSSSAPNHTEKPKRDGPSTRDWWWTFHNQSEESADSSPCDPPS